MRLYIFSSIVVDVIKEQTEIIDIAEDLIPMLLDYQFRHVTDLPETLRQKIGGDDILQFSSLSVVSDDDLHITNDLDRPPPSSIMLPSPRNSIKKEGSSIRDFRDTFGKTGNFQKDFNVYDREGKNCKRFKCKGIIKKKIISNRSTFFCNICQK